MRITAKALASVALAVVLSMAVATASAQAAESSGIVVEDGVTQPVFGYADAIRERVFVESSFDTDGDTLNDRIALDIIRPRASATGLKVPVIMDPSPYYSTLGRGNEGELKSDSDLDGLNDRWPLFYDNYFVPRGYAVVLLDMVGTNNSNGCPVTGAPPDFLSVKVAVDWLNGRAVGRDRLGTQVFADWHNGKAGAIGKSYDGTLANGAAATGVEGLTTIVPISAISSWYDYTRSNGVVTRGNSYPSSLSNTVTNIERRPYCALVREQMAQTDGDEHGDYTEFWSVRDYNKDVANVKASVFVVHGINDNNVKPDHFSKWWYGLAAHDVPRKLWLTQTGHVDPFDFRRAHWVSTIHRWFDHWLHGVENGIMGEPVADIERAADVWETYADWPVPGTVATDVWLRPGAPDANGLLGLTPNVLGTPTQSFVDTTSQSESTMTGAETTIRPSRRVFLSAPLTAPVHVSGTPVVRLEASANRTDTNFGAILVDYGADTRVAHRTSGEGISTLTTEDCWGESTAADNGCYRQTRKNTTTASIEVVTKGILDALNRDSLTTATPLVPDAKYAFEFPLLPEDYVFKTGHRIGVVVVGSYSGYSSQTDPSGATITLDVKLSKIVLPVVGGRDALRASGAFVADSEAPTLTLPTEVVADATSPAGATVAYTASASDTEDPEPSLSCAPASGSVFAIGTTTVACTATDWAGNVGTGSFTVRVRGPAEFLAELRASLAGVGPGTSLADKIRDAEAAFAAGDTAATCKTLLRTFPHEVDAQTGKTLTAAQAQALKAEARRIAVVVGCT